MTTVVPDTDSVVEDGYVPVVSLAGMEDPRHREEIARQLGGALRRSGFYVVVDHDVPRRLFDDLCTAALQFFHLPEAAKLTAEAPNSNTTAAAQPLHRPPFTLSRR